MDQLRSRAPCHSRSELSPPHKTLKDLNAVGARRKPLNALLPLPSTLMQFHGKGHEDLRCKFPAAHCGQRPCTPMWV